MDLNKQPNRQVIYLKERYKNIKKKKEKKLSKKRFSYLTSYKVNIYCVLIHKEATNNNHHHSASGMA